MVNNAAEEHKKKGNAFFSNGEYKDAISEYTSAIIKDSSNPVYYSNRALCYYRLNKFEETQNDAQRAIDLDASSLKGHYYLGLALTKLQRLKQADTHLARAYELSLAQGSKSSAHISEAMLQLRKAKWEHDEAARRREADPLQAELLALLESARAAKAAALDGQRQAGALGAEEYADEVEYLAHEHARKIKQLKTTFVHAGQVASAETGERLPQHQKPIPDYLLDPISFNLFVDPVITKSGQSYERSWILEHLRTSKTDPFSRAPLTEKDLIPNLALKAAAEQFIESQGIY